MSIKIYDIEMTAEGYADVMNVAYRDLEAWNNYTDDDRKEIILMTLHKEANR